MAKKVNSSGAQKAEALADNKTPEKKTKKTTAEKETVAKDTKKNARAVKSAEKKGAKKHKERKLSERAKKRREAHEKKVAQAKKVRAEKKQARLERKKAYKERKAERRLAAKQAREERKEKRRERRDMLKHETKEKRLVRKAKEREARIAERNAKRQARLAEKRAKREHALKVRAERRAASAHKQRTPGFGGWLAAVIALGVTTLALGAMTTFGWINMNGMQADMATVHTESMYELNSIVDNLDSNLSKARVSNSRNEQVRLLTDIAVESEMAETVLERLPLETQTTQNLTSFINKMGDSAQEMLYSVASGKKLTESQIASLEHMYKTNLQFKEMINRITSSFNGKDMISAINGKADGLINSSFTEIQNNTIETPKEIHDGPFAENIKKVSPKNLEGLKEITASKAETLAKKYFNGYNVQEANCTGETTAEQLTVFNINLTTPDGEMSAQLSKLGGKVVAFNSFKDCNDKNFDIERCEVIAQEFLNELGYTGMKAVWSSENGTTCNLNFAYEQDGVVVYPDMIKVKVCEERGIVTGIEALSYVLNHTERQLPTAGISKSQAREKLNGGFDVKTSRLCLIPFDGGESLAYEFSGTFEGSTYYIYIDAKSGEELNVFTVVGTNQGRALL